MRGHITLLMLVFLLTGISVYSQVSIDKPVNLTGIGSNMIQYTTAGVNPPAFTTRSTGTKVVLYPEISGTMVDYALGIDNNTLWYTVPNNTSTFSHKFYAATTELMRIRGDGNVGIGIAAPIARLSVYQSGSHEVAHFIQGSPTTHNLDVWWSSGSNDWLLSKRTVDGSHDMWFWSGALNQSVVTLKHSGRVGIGITAPSTKLHVEATAIDAVGHLLVNRSSSGGLGGQLTIGNRTAAAVGSAAALAFELDNSTAFNTGTGATEANAEIRASMTNGTNGASDLIFTNWSGTAEVEGLRIRAGGNVGIGTSTPVARLEVKGTMTVNNGNNYANNNNHMAPGSLVIGDIQADFGGGSVGWNTNTAGLMLEAKDNTEIVIHDSGTRLTSAMYYSGANNRLTIGRDMGGGFGTADVAVGNLAGGGNRAVYADNNGVLKPSVLPRAVTIFAEVAGFPSGTYNFATNGGTIILFVSGSGYKSPGVGLIGANVVVDGVQRHTMRTYTNETASHKAFPPGAVVITGLAAGNHTLTYTNYNSTSFDSNDFFGASFIEVAP